MSAEPGWVSKWQAVMARGALRYIVFTGILGYGLAMFVFTTFIAAHPALTARYILLRVLIWAVAGLLFGVLMWTFTEWRFKRVRASSPWQPPEQA